VSGSTAVEKRGISVVNNLSENKGLVLFAGREGLVARLVAKSKFRRLGHRVIVGTPKEFDSIAHGGIYGERYISKNALGRGNYDSVGCAATATTRSHRGWRHLHG